MTVIVVWCVTVTVTVAVMLCVHVTVLRCVCMPVPVPRARTMMAMPVCVPVCVTVCVCRRCRRPMVDRRERRPRIATMMRAAELHRRHVPVWLKWLAMCVRVCGRRHAVLGQRRCQRWHLTVRVWVCRCDVWRRAMHRTRTRTVAVRAHHHVHVHWHHALHRQPLQLRFGLRPCALVVSFCIVLAFALVGLVFVLMLVIGRLVKVADRQLRHNFTC